MCYSELKMSTSNYFNFLFAPIKHVVESLSDSMGIKALIAMFASLIGYVVHDNVIGVTVLLGLVFIDQFTGVWLALKEKTFSSSSFRNGLVKLLFYLIIVASFHSLAKINNTIFFWLHLDTAALSYLAVTEVISIVENASLILGLPFPNWIMDKLRIFVKFGQIENPNEKNKSIKHNKHTKKSK